MAVELKPGSVIQYSRIDDPATFRSAIKAGIVALSGGLSTEEQLRLDRDLSVAEREILQRACEKVKRDIREKML